MIRSLRHAAIAALIGAALLLPAQAAPPQGGPPAGTFNSVLIGSIGVPTYSVAVSGLTPAASATDFLTIQGAAGKVVRLTRLRCTGISTAAASATVEGIIRSSLNTGTSGRTTLTAAPLDSADAAPVAIVYTYTTNPSPLGTTVAIVRADTFNTSAAAGGGATALDWTFPAGEEPQQSVVLRGAAQLFALNGVAASFAAGTAFNCWMSWTETPN